jgi:uncharacterized membrane protein YdjX (TVP38/TMEM64 family)
VSDKQPVRSRGKIALYVLGAVVVIALLLLGGRQLAELIPGFADRVKGMGVWGPVAFIVGYALATVAFAPGSLLTLAAGAIFGLGFGTLYTFIGATLGACAAFLIARYGARGWIEKKIAGNARFAAIDKAVGREGFKIVALLRLSPIFPFNLLNYSLGLTQVPFGQYAAASIAMLPGTILYVYYGQAAGSLATALAGKSQKGPEQWVLLGIGLLATVVVTAFVTRLAGKALKQQIGDTPSSPAAEATHA